MTFRYSSSVAVFFKMAEKAADVQRKTLKDLQGVWRTIAQDHFKNYKVWLLGSKVYRNAILKKTLALEYYK